jgi:hypothetical protein
MDLWTEASADHDALAKQAAMARAEADFNQVFPFLAAARTVGEFGQRLALAQDSLASIALHHGIDPDELTTMAVRRFELMREALTEGTDPLDWIPDGGGYGNGPEKPDEHDTGVDFSHSYAEVPQGAPDGPDPRVVTPQPAGSVQQAEGGRHRRAGAHRRTAGATDMVSDGGVDTGLGAGMVDTGTSPTDPALAAGGNLGQTTPVTPPSIGQVTSAADPVRRQVMAVTASIKATNPSVDDAAAERIARKVVGRYLTADLDSSVIGNDPDGGESGGQGDHQGMSGPEELMLGRSVVKAAPAVAEALL